MRMKGPKVPPAAALVPSFFSFVGPRVPEGTYTVKMIKNKETYTSQLNLVADPRSKHTKEDRAAQFAVVMKLYNMLGDLTYTADAITGTRNQARERAMKIADNDPARRQLEDFVKALETIRTKLVATKEGGGITGEEKIREQMGTLYGSVNGYEGRPTASQIERATALSTELAAIVAEFEALTKNSLPAVNAALTKNSLGSIAIMTRAEWEKTQAVN